MNELEKFLINSGKPWITPKIFEIAEFNEQIKLKNKFIIINNNANIIYS